jgi:hypothetical protein
MPVCVCSLCSSPSYQTAANITCNLDVSLEPQLSRSLYTLPVSHQNPWPAGDSYVGPEANLKYYDTADQNTALTDDWQRFTLLAHDVTTAVICVYIPMVTTAISKFYEGLSETLE